MVDFRYHLVSLISVFLALAIGVVLGAGPLQTPIASGLSGQLETLRAEQAAVAADVEAARTEIAHRNNWIETVSKDVLAGSMTGRTVALVTFPTTRAEDVQAITGLIEHAGGSVNQTVSVTEGWYGEDMAQYRNSLSSAVLTHLAQNPGADASSAQILARGLVQALTQDDDESKILRELFTDEQLPLTSLPAEAAASQSIIVIGPVGDESSADGSDTDESALYRPGKDEASAAPGQSDTTDEESEETEKVTEIDPLMLAGLAQAVADAPQSGVVVGSAEGAKDLITVVRENQAEVTTVDGVGTSMGNASAVLALVTAGKEARAFGNGTGAQALIPPLPGTSGQRSE